MSYDIFPETALEIIGELKGKKMAEEMAQELLEEEKQAMKEENILLPGEVKLTDEELTLMKTLLEDHLVKVQIELKKINHLQSEDGE